MPEVKTIKSHREEIKDIWKEIKKKAESNMNLLSEEDKKHYRRYKKVGRPKAVRTLKPIKCKYKVDKQPRTFRVSREYDFLTYYGLVIKWALRVRPELNEADIKMLLRLYGQENFQKDVFFQVFKILRYGVKFNQKTKLQWFIDNGYIKVVREKTVSAKALYGLTQSCCLFLNKIHRYCCGAEKIPHSDMEVKKKDWRTMSPIAKAQKKSTLELLAEMDKRIEERDKE